MKEDFKRYGGKAYFTFDQHSQKLVLTHVSAPDSDIRVAAIPENKSFRQIEDILLASSMLHTVVGKHCNGIHAYMNLLAVALHNNFDTKEWSEKRDKKPHPFRVLLYIHTFNHIMVEELTTSHLLDKNGIFAQCFGYTHNGLAEYFNSLFNNTKYASDADFQHREKVYHGVPPQHSQLGWEQAFHQIHTRYAKGFIDAYYHDDKAIQDDNDLQSFKDELEKWLPNKLADRHDFQSKESVIRFIADTMHILTVRHEIYGTNITYTLDPKIMTAQVPIDHGRPSIEEYYSLLCVAYGTSRAAFGKMKSDKLQSLLPSFEKQEEMTRVFKGLQEDYQTLENAWTANDDERQLNQETMRNIPSDLETGAGY